MHVPEQRVLDIARITAEAAAKHLSVDAEGVLIGSTGVIGKQMPIDRLTAGIEVLAGKKNDSIEKWYRGLQKLL